MATLSDPRGNADPRPRMNCFVIMPFAPEFDDVHAVIKSAVESEGCDCLRLDEIQSAGRITERLLQRLQGSTFCVADLTGLRPNIMWEVGFAMALGRPTIILTQDAGSLPFDIKDMHTIAYDRTRLTATLAVPLRQSAAQTMAHLAATTERPAPTPPGGSEAYATLKAEVADLKTMLAETVRAWKTDSPEPAATQSDAPQLIGNWISEQSGGSMYSRVIHGSLVTAYSYGTDDELAGLYYDWRRIGEHWFARFKWLHDEPAGFAFMRQESPERLVGAWWESYTSGPLPDAPPKHAGIASVWTKVGNGKPPRWAERALRDVEQRGLATVLLEAMAVRRPKK